MNKISSNQEMLIILEREHKAGLHILKCHPGIISFIQSDDICSSIITMKGAHYIVQEKINSIEGELQFPKFFRCGRDYIVNNESVIGIMDSSIPKLFLSCGNNITLSLEEVPRIRNILENNQNKMSSKLQIAQTDNKSNI